MDKFHQDLLKIVRSIPSGRVVSYGQVAAYLGQPKASREVGWAMRDLGNEIDFPWWRVLSVAGRISLDNPDVSPDEQQRFLEGEGVEFTEPLVLDIEKYRYRPERSVLLNLGLSSERAEELFAKYTINQPPLL